MKTTRFILVATNLLFILSITSIVKAQNSSPFWSLAGNNNATPSSKLGTTNNISLRFYTNNVQRMIINSPDGNIGIGVPAPTDRLHINSAAGQNPFRVQVNGASKLFMHNNGGTTIGSGSTPPANGLYVTGNVGIGTAAPAVKLQVLGGSDAVLVRGGYIICGPTTGANLVIDDNEIIARSNGKTTALFLNNNGGNTIFNGANVEGNVAIGNIAPANRLHVRQAIPNKGIEWQHETTADFWTVGIGTNTLNCRFEFNGQLRGQISSVDGSFIAGSDLRLKQDIESMPGVMDKVMQLKPSKYFYKDSRHTAKNKSLGFIAQDVEKLFPEMVYDMDGGYKGLSYAAFAVVAIKAIQEQQENITQQQNNILEQKETISTLQDRIARLEAAVNALTANTREITGISLQQNSPNPFRKTTTFRYDIPENSKGKLAIYDVSGKLVKSLDAPAGGSATLSANELKAGTYIYTLLVNGKPAASKKMVLVQ